LCVPDSGTLDPLLHAIPADARSSRPAPGRRPSDVLLVTASVQNVALDIELELDSKWANA